MEEADLTRQPAVVLTIAGSDSGGCAGIQADLRTFSSLGLHGTTAITAVTAQNTKAVTGVEALSAAFVVEQIRTVLDDFHILAVKTGMLANPAIVEAVAELAADGLLPHLVVDPVLVSTSGHVLMDEGGVEAYRTLLLPHAQIVTPNLAEAALLSGRHLSAMQSIEGMAAVGRALLQLGAGGVLIKGGHLGAPSDNGPGDDGAAIDAGDGADGVTDGDWPPAMSPDVFASREGTVTVQAPRILTENDHGTGCSLSAAIAAGLAVGSTPLEAVRSAKDFVSRALAGASHWELGSGHGPIDHMGWGSRGS